MGLIFRLFAEIAWGLQALFGFPFRAWRRKKRPLYVRLRIDAPLGYRDPPRRFGRGPKGIASVRGLERLLARLARDPELKGVVLILEGAGLGPSKRAAVAALLRDFRRRGKEIIGYAVMADNAGYALLCSASRVVMPSAGRLQLVGFSAEATALARGLERAGIGAHFVRRGDYKTAPELFTHERISDIQRKTIEGFLDERFEELISVIAEGRVVPPEVARARIDAGPYSAARARHSGLVDVLESEADLGRMLSGSEDEEVAERAVVDLEDYDARLTWPPRPKDRWRKPPVLSVVRLSGMIVDGEAPSAPVGPTLLGAKGAQTALRAAAEDPRSEAVLLYVDSPGGSAVASELMLDEVKRTARKKPVLAYVDRVAASGGYMVALGAKEIWSAPHAIVGSIGVFSGKFEAAGLLAKLGISREVITRGERAGLYSTSRPFSDSEREALEAEVEEIYRAFLQRVATARGKTPEWVHERAEGRVYSGKRALEEGLVDHVGAFEEAGKHALAVAGVVTEDFRARLHSTSKRRKLIERFMPGSRPEIGVFDLLRPEAALGAWARYFAVQGRGPHALGLFGVELPDLTLSGTPTETL